MEGERGVECERDGGTRREWESSNLNNVTKFQFECNESSIGQMVHCSARG